MLNESHSFDTLVVTQWDAAPQNYTQQVKTAIGQCLKDTGLSLILPTSVWTGNTHLDRAFIMSMHLEAASHDSRVHLRS